MQDEGLRYGRRKPLQSEDDLPFIVDANVLIDYCESDLRILSLLSTDIDPVHIARSTFEKVEQLTAAAARKHHPTIVTPDFDTVFRASQERGALANDDRETLWLAKLNDCICITNDTALRRECGKEEVSCLWGLEPMKTLVEFQLISRFEAIVVARNIQVSNPGYITEGIVSKFAEQIGAIPKQRRGSD